MIQGKKWRGAALGLALWMGLAAVPVDSVAAADKMTVRMTASAKTVWASALAEGDVVLQGALYLDNYTALTALKVSLGSDAPLVIENGGFTQPTFFEACGMGTTYTQYSEETGLSNICCWNGPGTIESPGVVANPEGSLLSFDVRIPQGTAPGVYRLFLKDTVTTTNVGKKIYSFYAYNGSEQLDCALEACTVVVSPDVLRGDTNGDGLVDADDATSVLRYYVGGLTGLSGEAQCALFATPYLEMAYAAADVNFDEKRDAGDASLILQYYVTGLSGLKPDWTDLCGA